MSAIECRGNGTYYRKMLQFIPVTFIIQTKFCVFNTGNCKFLMFFANMAALFTKKSVNLCISERNKVDCAASARLLQ